MRVVSWNIQAARGCDGRNALEEILALLHAKHADVICLQEIARHLPEYGSADQLAAFADAFEDFDAVWAPGFSWPEARGRSEFGNLTLVRKLQLADARIHLLPAPVSSQHLQMPRTAVEVVVETGLGGMRVFNTHLAFHCADERREQLAYLTAQKMRAEQQAKRKAPQGSVGSYRQPPSPCGVLLCGDLNLTPDSDDYHYLQLQEWQDCWPLCQHEQAHLPTCGVFDTAQWPQGPHCRDFGLINSALVPMIEAVQVELTTDASDHQPLILDFNF